MYSSIPWEMGLALDLEPERPVSQTWWISAFPHDDQAVEL
jgi:hypothetical protein